MTDSSLNSVSRTINTQVDYTTEIKVSISEIGASRLLWTWTIKKISLKIRTPINKTPMISIAHIEGWQK